MRKECPLSALGRRGLATGGWMVRTEESNTLQASMEWNSFSLGTFLTRTQLPLRAEALLSAGRPHTSRVTNHYPCPASRVAVPASE